MRSLKLIFASAVLLAQGQLAYAQQRQEQFTPVPMAQQEQQQLARTQQALIADFDKFLEGHGVRFPPRCRISCFPELYCAIPTGCHVVGWTCRITCQ
jgi:hypothetical protein